ncbi:hypothetical protein HOLleu_04353 [Holothuria leucospilota]|uniref:Ig-like domain-containing protein n=1 Tax=Holothuria leucospilota TaxID=206669 RepID=A0A9Q1CTR4_HOLLE|nr:hypothetical protein HOLleu_04353 [Holothuria leucospilota]
MCTYYLPKIHSHSSSALRFCNNMGVHFQFLWIQIFPCRSHMLIPVLFISSALSTTWHGEFIGGSVYFACNITDASTAGWRRNTEELFAGEFDLLQNDNAYVSALNYSLIVFPIYLEDEGVYQCLKSDTVVSTYYLHVKCLVLHKH